MMRRLRWRGRELSWRGWELSKHSATLVVAATLLVSGAAWAVPAPPPAEAPAAKRASARCITQANLDACNDAIRRNPSDPKLLVALGDALVRAKRPADAIRNYHRAAALAPHMPGVAAKLSDAENQLASVRAPVAPRRLRYSNSSPETQSH